MDAAAKPGRPLDDATKDLKINTLALNSSSANMSGHKDASASDAISCISSVDATITIEDGEMDQEAMMGEQGMCYHAYYYPGFNGLLGEWESPSYVMGTDGSGVQHHAIKADDGSVVYYYPGYHSGYTPYGPFLPGAMIGVEGQYLTHQSYYPSPISPQPLVSSGLFPQPIFYGPELVPAYPWYPSHFYHNGHQESIFSMDSTNSYSKSNYPKRHTLNRSKPLPTSSAASELEGSAPASVKSQAPAIEKQPCKPVNKEAAAAAVSEAYLSVDKLPSLSNQGKDKMLYSNSPINMKENGRCWTGDEKLEARNKLNVTGNFDVLSEQNHGPRTNGTFWPGVNPIESPSAKKDHGSSVSTATIDENEYDHPDFLTKYEHALFFVIKSYSEDDIHKSIKYNVWASTPNGNKRLDNAFKLAEEKMAEKNTKCPVFLFFSVNASGQFCGVAEMMGRVDFGKNMDFWQQDKWNGFFPVKWHIIKDIPNPQFRHIILENNDNKPVTNSRDTQEVKFPQGTEMLNIFSSYFSKTSILDDFIFYENRQKAMESKRNHQPALNLMHPLSRNNDLPHASGLGDSKFIVSAPETMKLSAAQTEEELQTRVAAKE